MKIRNGKNCCLRLEQFKNETWTRGTQEGFFSLGQSRKTRFAPAATLSHGNLYIKFFLSPYPMYFVQPSPNPFYTLNR